MPPSPAQGQMDAASLEAEALRSSMSDMVDDTAAAKAQWEAERGELHRAVEEARGAQKEAEVAGARDAALVVAAKRAASSAREEVVWLKGELEAQRERLSASKAEEVDALRGVWHEAQGRLEEERKVLEGRLEEEREGRVSVERALAKAVQDASEARGLAEVASSSRESEGRGDVQEAMGKLHSEKATLEGVVRELEEGRARLEGEVTRLEASVLGHEATRRELEEALGVREEEGRRLEEDARRAREERRALEDAVVVAMDRVNVRVASGAERAL